MEESKGNIEREFGTNYTCIPLDILKDKNISCKARGLYATIMGLPREWQLSVEGLQSILKEGRDAIYSALKELRTNGYVETHQSNVRGRFGGTVYTFYSTPRKASLNNEPVTENPHTDNPNTENPRQYNNINNIIYNNNSHTITREKENSWESMVLTDAWTINLQLCVFRQFGYKPETDELQKHLDSFISLQMAKQKPFFESDAKSHFVNYLISRIEKEQSKTNNHYTHATNRNISTEESRLREAEELVARLIAADEATQG